MEFKEEGDESVLSGSYSDVVQIGTAEHVCPHVFTVGREAENLSCLLLVDKQLISVFCTRWAYLQINSESLTMTFERGNEVMIIADLQILVVLGTQQ